MVLAAAVEQFVERLARDGDRARRGAVAEEHPRNFSRPAQGAGARRADALARFDR
jgi:hypothetical protein